MERKFTSEIVGKHEDLFREGLFGKYLVAGGVKSAVDRQIYLARRRWSPNVFG